MRWQGLWNHRPGQCSTAERIGEHELKRSQRDVGMATPVTYKCKEHHSHRRKGLAMRRSLSVTQKDRNGQHTDSCCARAGNERSLSADLVDHECKKKRTDQSTCVDSGLGQLQLVQGREAWSICLLATDKDCIIRRHSDVGGENDRHEEPCKLSEDSQMFSRLDAREVREIDR